MKMTPSRMATILRRADQLNDLARDFARDIEPNGRHGEVRVTDNGQVEEHINTACHCHPEYEWVERGTVEQFTEWLAKQSG